MCVHFYTYMFKANTKMILKETEKNEPTAKLTHTKEK